MVDNKSTKPISILQFGGAGASLQRGGAQATCQPLSQGQRQPGDTLQSFTTV